MSSRQQNNALKVHARQSREREAAASAKRALIDVREPSDAAELENYYDLRWRVLREPWSQVRGQERDEHEAGAIHIGAWYQGRLVGVGRVHFFAAGDAQIRYMAVEPSMQGTGIGGQILEELERRAREAGAGRIVLNARDRALDFYRKHGYAVVHESEVLFNAIPHWEMEKMLAPRRVK